MCGDKLFRGRQTLNHMRGQMHSELLLSLVEWAHCLVVSFNHFQTVGWHFQFSLAFLLGKGWLICIRATKTIRKRIIFSYLKISYIVYIIFFYHNGGSKWRQLFNCLGHGGLGQQFVKNKMLIPQSNFNLIQHRGSKNAFRHLIGLIGHKPTSCQTYQW